MKKRFCTLLLLLFSFAYLGNGMAASLSVDKQSVYQRATNYVALGLYEKALEQFEQIKGFSDSNSWANYCRGMVAIQTADTLEGSGHIKEAGIALEKASQYFSLLSALQFNDSEQLYKYCNARRFQLGGLKQPALDEFKNLSGVLDSDERFFAILNNIPLPTQAPIEEIASPLPQIACHAAKRVDVFWGPGNEYLKNNKIQINAESSLCICGQEKSYYLLETTGKDGKIRIWGPTVRIVRDVDQEVPQIGKKSRSVYVLADAEARMGPGEDYIRSGIQLKKGEKVTAFEDEGRYTMIEYKDMNVSKPIRVWFPTEYLSK